MWLGRGFRCGSLVLVSTSFPSRWLALQPLRNWTVTTNVSLELGARTPSKFQVFCCKGQDFCNMYRGRSLHWKKSLTANSLTLPLSWRLSCPGPSTRPPAEHAVSSSLLQASLFTSLLATGSFPATPSALQLSSPLVHLLLPSRL